ncbi:MAG: hypothetical protein RL660_466 [Bacteroidota bacterium]|jgi:hypothetical protein
MLETKYIVIAYGNTAQQARLTQTELTLHHSFDEAYKLFNEVCLELNETSAPPKPAIEQPMRQEQRRWIVELWIINRLNNY